MLVDFGLRDGKRPLAFTRPDQQELHIRPGPMHQRRCLEQGWNPFMPRHARDGDDDRGATETELLAKLRCGWGLRQGPLESLDIDSSATSRDHEAISPCHPVAFEKSSILFHLEHGSGGQSGCRTMHRAVHRTSR
jgi:hypothetical protein